MTSCDLYSEPFASTGNIAAEGFRRLLGTPALGHLTTVIREALQNSVDAALPGLGPKVTIRYRRLTPSQASVIRDRVFSQLPPRNGAEDTMAEVLAADRIGVLEIADFRTSGLGGPTRADVAHEGNVSSDFVNFLRNVGAARDTHLGGGTYGYGKTSLYQLSRCSTILIDSQTSYEGSPVRRLMGCQLGHAFDAPTSAGRRRFTGRHWWGRAHSESGIEPIDGQAARELSLDVGFPTRDENETGTSIMILAPMLDEEGDVEAHLVETVLWNFWPRMCRTTAHAKRLDVSLEVDGRVVEIPSPEDFPPLDLFAQALARCSAKSESTQVRCLNPARYLGEIAISKGVRAERQAIAGRDATRFPNPAAHIALMRPVELVVRYLEGTHYSDDRFEWAGVFICSDEPEVEQAFADSEPPAHDDWVFDSMPSGRGKTYVKVAMSRLKEMAATFANPLATTGSAGGGGPSLATVAGKMGRLLDRASGRGPDNSAGSRKGSGGTGGRRAAAVSSPRFAHLELDPSGRRYAIFESLVSNDGSSANLAVAAFPYLVMDGGQADADELPIDVSARVVQVSFDGRETDGHECLIGAGSGIVRVKVQIPDEAAVGLKMMLVRSGEPV